MGPLEVLAGLIFRPAGVLPLLLTGLFSKNMTTGLNQMHEGKKGSSPASVPTDLPPLVRICQAGETAARSLTIDFHR